MKRSKKGERKGKKWMKREKQIKCSGEEAER
jgi:hypothetical protein